MAAAVTYTTFAGELVHENRGGVETFFMPDTNGNVIGLIDDTGTVVAERTYWPYGEVMSTVGSWTTPFGFGGILGYLTDAVGKLYVRARYYRPTLARWQTVDPLWPDESAYGYVGGRPVDRVDPSGMICLQTGETPCSKLGASQTGICVASGCSAKSAYDFLSGLKNLVSDAVWKLIASLIKTVKDKPQMSPNQCCQEAADALREHCKDGKRDKNWIPKSIPELFAWLCCGDQVISVRYCEASSSSYQQCEACCDNRYRLDDKQAGICRNYCLKRWPDG